MKKIVLLIVTATLFVAGCGESEKEEGASIASFYKNLNVWLKDPTKSAAACAEVSPREIARSRKYARVITEGDVCQAALEENFTFLVGEDQYKLLSIEPTGPSGKELKVDREVQTQAVRISLETPEGQETISSQAAALISNDQIENLAGMRLSTLAPQQFAESLGSGQAIAIDPVSAAYYTSKDK